MDRLTQLQDAIDAMARMLTNSLFYVHEKSAMAELNNQISIAQPKIQADPPEEFNQNMHELATDLVKKAKEIDALIEVLPGIKNSEEEQVRIIILSAALLFSHHRIHFFFFFFELKRSGPIIYLKKKKFIFNKKIIWIWGVMLSWG
ncbi:subunit 21 of mediator complex-domain-containing protein [Circinella umbellata]|nr:subunit 21 of mediator complex-domain-containing protein [Circinella umbellata]